LFFSFDGENPDTGLLHRLVSLFCFLTQKPTETTQWAPRCHLAMASHYFTQNNENYEPPLVVSCLSADPFRDNGFYAVLSTLPDYTAVLHRRPVLP
jgi:hypothetical protein